MVRNRMALPEQLQRSTHISWFAHMGAVYLFHDLYGYLMEMSPDIADLVEAFNPGPTKTLDILGRFGTRFDGADPAQFIEVLVAHAVLIEPDEDELDGVWAYVPIKGKWNTWQRNGDRLRLHTAWGDRPITEIMLDADETRMWDAFDGEKRMNELKLLHDPSKLAALVRRLTHSDVQALKLSMMPWSAYAKRPGMAPPYLASTMPYPKWMPGTSVPPAVSLTDYHRDAIGDANEQFDHQETTLSHLLRIPHPTLSGRTYGEALADALEPKISDGDVRILEIGAGLGYVARDVIARLGSRVKTYTIVELSPALMAAQQKLIGDRATWIAGDALEVALPEADLIICNEMVGDLPARQLSRADIGMNIDMSGEVDLGRLRAYSTEAVECNVKLDDAPEPFYLQHGAFTLVAKIARTLAPGGTAVITEFGSPAMYPKLSSHLDHPELSTHFGQLLQVAKGSGLAGSIEFVIDLLDFQRDEKGLVTTRSQFRALRALCSNAGIDLLKIGYTPALLDHAVAEKLDLTTVGDLRWDRIEDRLMGLVPHEFKALLVSKPG
jgi:SAM-dependent methyltransferase